MALDRKEGNDGVSIVIPALDEGAALPKLIRSLSILEPPPAEILLVDGGSSDDTVAFAEAAGWHVVANEERGRSAQINRGVAEAQGPLICVLHADTILPDDAVAVIRATLADRRIALAGFTPIIEGDRKVRWISTLHCWLKTWYAPLLVRPHLFLRGMRLLFGDHAMFFRRTDFLAIGGCARDAEIMEDADLCVAMTRLGRVRLVNRVVRTSDRRIARWGELRANWIYFRIGLTWAFGLRKRVRPSYPEIR